MYLGNVVELLEKGRLSVNGVHPYTKALIKSIFKVDFKPGEKIQPLEGDIPSHWLCRWVAHFRAAASIARKFAEAKNHNCKKLRKVILQPVILLNNFLVYCSSLNGCCNIKIFFDE